MQTQLPPELPEVAAFVQVEDGQQSLLPMALHDLRGQRGVALDVVILDRTTDGDLDGEGGTVVRLGPHISVGEAHRAGLNHTRATVIAWHVLGVRNLPTRMAQQHAELMRDDGVAMLTTNMVLTDADGQIVAMADPKKALDSPTPLWQSGVMIRRAALARVGRSPDLPVELFLYSRLRAHGRTGHIAEPLCVVDETRFEAEQRQSLTDAAAVQRIHPPIAPPPEVSVIVTATSNASAIRRVLAALAMQDLAPSRYEVLLVDTGDICGLDVALSGIDVPYALTTISRHGEGLSAVRNAALQEAVGDIVVFMGSDLQPSPDNLRLHLERHRAERSPRSILGEVIVRSTAVRDSVAHLIETTSIASARPEMRPGASYKGQAFSCSNLSVQRHHLLRIGGFDASFCGEGAEEVEIGLRLERALGMPVVFDPDIRATRRDPMDIRSVVTRHRMLGWCTQRMARKHDDPSILLGGSTMSELTEFWASIRSEVVDSGEEIRDLISRIKDLCESERSMGGGPQHVEEIEPLLQRLCALEFGRGLLGGRAGMPLDSMVRPS